MVEPTRGKAEKLYLEGIQQSLRSVWDSQTEDADCQPRTSSVCIEIVLRESEYNRVTGCGKTARPGLCGGRPVMGVSTARDCLWISICSLAENLAPLSGQWPANAWHPFATGGLRGPDPITTGSIGFHAFVVPRSGKA